MAKFYNKLVRDRIPEIIQAEGRQCEVEVLTEAAYRAALLDKLLEEAQELRTAPAEQMVDELADIFELIDAIISAYKLNRATILESQEHKRHARGGFARRLKLVSTD